MSELLRAMHDRIRRGTNYRGIPAIKNPCDWWAYMEIVHETEPDFIVEIGNLRGGTLLALADFCDATGLKTRVVGVDIRHDGIAPAASGHGRVRLVTGEATAVAPLVSEIVGGGRCMVIEDSAHTYDNTLACLRAYSGLVTPGCYYVVEDTIYDGLRGLGNSWPGGAGRAVDAFLAEDVRFERDRDREWPVTWNPGGFIKRRGA